MQEPFKVCVRIKPYEGKSRFHCVRNGNETNCHVDCPTSSLIQVDTMEQRVFTFDNVFNERESNKDIYNHSIAQMISDCVTQGYNGTILAYGQTGSGKSYTMFGNLYDPNNSEDGMVSLVFQQLYQMNVKISISYLEIYNEQIRDLIGDQTNLTISEDPIKGVIVQDAQEIVLSGYEQALNVVINGNQKRVMAATNANSISSRSHAIIQLLLTYEQFQSKISLVDLAGSEKGNVSEGKGIRQQEGSNINKSLLALGNCINMLGDNNSQIKKFVPYRDSKLTRLLKDSLGGNTKTLMIGCVQQAMACNEESINTLKYASRARAIKKKITQNIRPIDNNNNSNNNDIVPLLQAEIALLKQEILQFTQYSDEEIEIKMNLKQIDYLQQANREGLNYQIEQLKLEDSDPDKLNLEIQEYERAIEENERVRQQLLSQYNSRKRQDLRDFQLELLKSEIVQLKESLRLKDQIIEQFKQEQRHLISRPNTSYQETDRHRIQEQSCDLDARKDSLQYCPSSKSIKQQSSNSQREDDQPLIQLNKARESFKIFRTKLYSLREKLQSYLIQGSQISQEQLKQVVELMNDLGKQKYRVSPEDQELILQFQQLLSSYQKQQTQPSVNNRSRSMNVALRSKVQSTHVRKPLQQSNHSPLNFKPTNLQCKNINRNRKDPIITPTQSVKQKFIMEYTKKVTKSPMHSFSSENSNKEDHFRPKTSVVHSYPNKGPFASIQQ